MFFLIFITSVFLLGILISILCFKGVTGLHFFSLSFILGSIISVFFVYVFTIFLNKEIYLGLLIYFFTTLIILISFRKRLKDGIKYLIENITGKQFAIITFLFLFSFLLFEKSFSYDQGKGHFLISSNLYQDMGAHIPFIRSFSNGNNFPSEIPFFAGSKLMYHFMFDLYAGILEFLGLRIDFAYNAISAVSLTFFILVVYALAKKIFSSSFVGIISVILFFFNSDLSFFKMINQQGISLLYIWHKNMYESGSLFSIPYSPFLHINVILNQRHLIFSLLIVFSLILLILEKKLFKTKPSLIAGILLIGLLPFWNAFAYFSIVIVLLCILITGLVNRKNILILLFSSFIIALSQLIMLKSESHIPILIKPGFLIANNFSLMNLFYFWFWSLGASIIFILLGFILSSNKQKQIFIIFLPLFILPNIFQFAPDMFDNHKFFNIWIVMANIFAAFGLSLLLKKGLALRMLAFCGILLMVVSGVLNFIVVKNDIYVRIQDYKKNSLMNFVNNYIPKRSIILTNGEIYDPISLTGNRLFITRPRYIFLYGGNSDKKEIERRIVMDFIDKEKADNILHSENIAYIIVYKGKFAPNALEYNETGLRNNFQKIYEDNYGVVFKI